MSQPSAVTSHLLETVRAGFCHATIWINLFFYIFIFRFFLVRFRQNRTTPKQLLAKEPRKHGNEKRTHTYERLSFFCARYMSYKWRLDMICIQKTTNFYVISKKKSAFGGEERLWWAFPCWWSLVPLWLRSLRPLHCRVYFRVARFGCIEITHTYVNTASKAAL